MLQSQESLRYCLALHHAPGVGPAAFKKILQEYGDVEYFFNAGAFPQWLNSKTKQWLCNPNWNAVDAELQWLDHPHHHIITQQDAAYPTLLKESTGAPALLYVKGNLAFLSDVQLAIVGSRNPTPDGRQQAYHFAQNLSGHGITIVSGLAMGVDASAHKGALLEKGSTLAVVATGLDRVYPASNRDLAYEIAEKGALVSEFPLGTPPKVAYFPRRNRIISGLSVGTLVVEAGMKSGSLITARLALEQGREVFAIPGSIHNPMVRGCHSLIRQGAKLVENVEHIFEELAPLLRTIVDKPSVSPATQAPQTKHFQANNPPRNKPHTNQSIEQNTPPKASLKQRLEAVPDSSENTPAGGQEQGISQQERLNDKEKRLLSCLGFEPTATDVLVDRSGFSVSEVNAMLVSLELNEHLTAFPGGLYVRAASV